MSTFWGWVETKSDNKYRVIAEAVEQQQQRFQAALTQKFPTLLPGQINQLLAAMAEQEKLLTDPDDQRKSATVSKFLKNFKPDEAASTTHNVDRFRIELSRAVQTANAKGKTPEQVAGEVKMALKAKLPGEPEEVINALLDKVQKGARIDDVVRGYLASKRAAGENDKVVHQEGQLKMIEIKTFVPQGTDKHLDSGEHVPCHRLFRGTKWCVRFEDYFDRYAGNYPLYLVTNNDQPVVLGHPDSPWLDTEDEPPDPVEMIPVSQFIVNGLSKLQNGHSRSSMIRNIILYLPKPAEQTVQYVKANLISPEEASMALLGVNRPLLAQGTMFIIDTWDNMEDCLEGLRKFGNNDIRADLAGIEESVNGMVMDQNFELSDLANNLSSKVEDALIDYMSERPPFKGDDSWDDRTLEEWIEADEEVRAMLVQASEMAMTEATMKRVRYRIMQDLEGGDGTWTVSKMFTLYTRFNDVNMWCKELVEKARKSGSIDHETTMIDTMEIRVDEPEYELSFDSMLYSNYVMESIKQG